MPAARSRTEHVGPPASAGDVTRLADHRVWTGRGYRQAEPANARPADAEL